MCDVLHAEPPRCGVQRHWWLRFRSPGWTSSSRIRPSATRLSKSARTLVIPCFAGNAPATRSMVGSIDFRPQREPIGFIVDGTIEDDKIILRGVAPALGLSSCKIETTYYDTLLLTAVAAPGGCSRPALPCGVQARSKRISRSAGQAIHRVPSGVDLAAVDRGVGAQNLRPPPLCRPRPPPRSICSFPFSASSRTASRPSNPHTEPYYHEALEYRPPSSYAVCSATKVAGCITLYDLSGRSAQFVPPCLCKRHHRRASTHRRRYLDDREDRTDRGRCRAYSLLQSLPRGRCA